MKKNNKKKINKKAKKIIITALLTIITLYVLYTIYLLVKDPTDICTVEEGTLIKEESVVGYIIRNETILKGQNYKNGMVQIIGEYEKTAKDETIFRYYSNNEEELVKKIDELDIQIQNSLENENNLLSSDIKQIEKQIDEKVEKLNQLNDTQKILEYKKEVNNLINKKAEIAGELSPSGSRIKKLIQQRSKYEQQLNSGAEYVKSPQSGVVSYKIDGLENVLTTQDFGTLNKDTLDKLNLKTGKMISSSEEAGKVIDNFECYIATIVKSEEALNADINKKVKIRLANNEEIEATINYKSEQDDDSILLVLKLDKLTQELVNYRKISFDIIWWSDSGLKVPNQAIVEENGLKYVVRSRAGYLSKILVNVLRTNDKYSIVDNYSTDELKEMKYSISEILSYKKISIFDEILLNPHLEKIN